MPSDKPHRPSLLNRVARRLEGLRERGAEAARLVREEAAHPGEPQPHLRARAPLHQTAEDRAADAAAPSVEYRPGGDTSVDPLARPAQDGTAGDDAWYLQGENEGWDQTDPDPKR